MRWTATVLAVAALGGLTAGASDAAARPRSPATRVVLVLDHGAVHQSVDRLDPAFELPNQQRAQRSRAPIARVSQVGHRSQPSFASDLDRLLASGSIDQAARDHYRKSLLDARRSLGRLGGTRRVELGAVLANLEQIAASGMLTPSRLPALVLTLERNRQWWTTGPLLSDGQRVGFPGSGLVWEYYTGQGIQIQWLGSFGKANGYFLGGRTHDDELTALLDELVGLSAQRAGGIAWEYEFRFDGGVPPWVSGLAQGTAIQALARAAARFARPDYFVAAHSALNIFETPPPDGVRVATPAGAHYLIYSFAPGERVLNGFIQSLVGLHDYAALAGDDTGRSLFAAGEAEARLEVPVYDTGAWSLYDQSTESDLSYHMLLRDFLSHLCERLRAPAAPAAPGPTAAASSVTGAAPGSSGGTPATGPAAPPPPPPTPPPPPSADVYCATADRFTAYVHQPPTITVAAIGPERVGRAAQVGLTLSKISLVRLRAQRGGRTVYRVTQQFGHGKRMLVWHPRQPGIYRLSTAATDLAGNSAAAVTTVTVARARKHR